MRRVKAIGDTKWRLIGKTDGFNQYKIFISGKLFKATFLCNNMVFEIKLPIWQFFSVQLLTQAVSFCLGQLAFAGLMIIVICGCLLLVVKRMKLPLSIDFVICYVIVILGSLLRSAIIRTGIIVRYLEFGLLMVIWVFNQHDNVMLWISNSVWYILWWTVDEFINQTMNTATVKTSVTVTSRNKHNPIGCYLTSLKEELKFNYYQSALRINDGNQTIDVGSVQHNKYNRRFKKTKKPARL